jgi:osmotically-inducible protein OsmY
MTAIQRFLAVLLAASTLIVAGCAGTSTSASTGEYIDDSVITTRVKTAIFNEPSLKVSEINVETYKSVVQLSGFVSSSANIATASSVARGIKGVQSVKNDIRVR